MTDDIANTYKGAEEWAGGADNHHCPSCNDWIEDWWNYCAMCGWHIAAGAPKPRLSKAELDRLTEALNHFHQLGKEADET